MAAVENIGGVLITVAVALSFPVPPLVSVAVTVHFMISVGKMAVFERSSEAEEVVLLVAR